MSREKKKLRSKKSGACVCNELLLWFTNKLGCIKSSSAYLSMTQNCSTATQHFNENIKFECRILFSCLLISEILHFGVCTVCAARCCEHDLRLSIAAIFQRNDFSNKTSKPATSVSSTCKTYYPEKSGWANYYILCLHFVYLWIYKGRRAFELFAKTKTWTLYLVSQPTSQPATESLFNSSTNVIRRWHSILLEIDLFYSGFVFASFLYSYSIFAVTFVLKNTNLFRISHYISRFVWRVWKKGSMWMEKKKIARPDIYGYSTK